MGGIFHTVLYQPLFNLLIWLYNVLPFADIGFAIIVLTIIIKLILWPFTNASLRSQKALQEIQPKLEDLKQEHKNDKEKLAKAMMELYTKEKVNPLSSCLPLLVQLPILWALYRVLRDGMTADHFDALYQFVSAPESIHTMFLGIVDLTKRSIPLAVLAGIFQFFQTRMLMRRRPPKDLRKKEGVKDENMMATMNKSMLYFMPVFTVFIGSSLPGGLTLYWVAVNVVSIIQQKIVFSKKEKPKSDGGVIDVEAKPSEVPKIQ
ncbi:MAG: YidC/Oxa1 family membrane protein insertase [Patescibacteria group bacterium]